MVLTVKMADGRFYSITYRERFVNYDKWVAFFSEGKATRKEDRFLGDETLEEPVIMISDVKIYIYIAFKNN